MSPGYLPLEGRAAGSRRPWLGMFTSETGGQVEVVGVAQDGPAARHGVQPGDVIVKVGDDPVTGMADMFRKMWSRGGAGVSIPLTILRGSAAMTLHVVSDDRNNRLKPQRRD